MSQYFSVGDRVIVRALYPLSHTRTPFYIRGKVGVIERVFGKFPNPEALAYGQDGFPLRFLYCVGFQQSHVWVDYTGSPEDTLTVDIYEHWLEPV
ncbi:Nitrile hydratase subunit beta (plasmid) [Planktothrix agardhii]|jgi:hypothetical protein|uniref:Putative Nitrile hydratase beta subunit n=1 Tax=Planktothrix agardhii TaxID=1160 RepID=A0A1J1JLG3_PLAAG|nr:SH3-like domain-containing protein [Planktothrix agardhii]CAD5984390.1 Nitrile hydratase subunit beta [Planktothrix agardhii]CUM62424.1 putative Nitrile hydratase beta subunit [Planktothrix agardhii]